MEVESKVQWDRYTRKLVKLIKLLLKNLQYNGADRELVQTTEIIVYLYKKQNGGSHHEFYTELLRIDFML